MPHLLRNAFVSVLLTLATAVVSMPASANDNTIDFSLTDHNGENFRLQDQRGKIVLVFFGYTRCPDVCPIELQHMVTALKRLGQDSGSALGLFVTVDPDHDTPEILTQYMSYFGSSLVGLTGSEQQIKQVAEMFRVSYRKKSRSNEQYTMDHTANLFVIDRDGRLSTIVPFGFPAAHIENLLREMIAAG